MLVDSAEITVKAGNGGDGVVRWRHEKYVPRGGPDGGDGGRGGSIFFEATDNLDTLSDFRYRKVFQAEGGEDGKSKKMYGKAGEDLTLLIPTGTIVTDLDTDQVLSDFVKVGQKLLVVAGGKGGLGNVHFVSSTHQNPMEHTTGKPGEKKALRLELRLIADIAIVGEPNAGKSSLINALSAAHSKIGAYAFTTTEPVLGVLRQGTQKLTLIDLPGLIEGAHRGRGLGDDFLKHTKRVKALLHVVNATSDDIDGSIERVKLELKEYEPALMKLPTQLVFNKIDLLTKDELAGLKKKYKNVIFVSAQDGLGTKELGKSLFDTVADAG